MSLLGLEDHTMPNNLVGTVGGSSGYFRRGPLEEAAVCGRS